MDVSEQLRDPLGAGIAAAVITSSYLYLKMKMNNEPPLPLNAYTKPALLNAIMVYFIVSHGVGVKETISVDPF
jgi:hypothetical protein